MKQTKLAVLIAVGIISSLTGCAHAPAGKGADSHTLFKNACGLGQANQAVKGTVWMKLDSRDAKGQFPASVDAVSPDRVTLEVTNLLGSREALIQVDRGSYTVDVPSRGKQAGHHAVGVGSWGGIPLRWASELFLGRIPCPAENTVDRIETTSDGDLVAETKTDKFTYHFRQWAGHAWAESLHWDGQGTQVDFKFDDPEDKTGSPRKWEAKSARGEVKLRWKDIQISR